MTAPASPKETATNLSALTTGVPERPRFVASDAEALIRTLPGVVSARVVTDPDGAPREVHVLATTELGPKQIVRNVESAMLARFGTRVDHRSISVAQSGTARVAEPVREQSPSPAMTPVVAPPPGRGIYFEDVEVRRSRTTGLACTVTLRVGDERYTGEASGMESSRARGDLAATAAVRAMAPLLTDGVALAVEDCVTVRVGERTYAFVIVNGRSGRDSTVLSGSAEVKDGLETAAVLAVLDATERWMERGGGR
ncbi:MAG TPA: hypothetical protein VHM67_14085 [Gemmatimonadaceae bacterium]|nr:hypothetical protein [Gemmatimonadaceae bacterium]